MTNAERQAAVHQANRDREWEEAKATMVNPTRCWDCDDVFDEADEDSHSSAQCPRCRAEEIRIRE